MSLSTDYNYQECEQYLLSIPLFKKEKNPLPALKNFLSYLGSPEEGKKIIHVAGTNGKGSICAYLASILGTAGITAGLFTSPHLVSIRERIKINGSDVTKKQFTRAFKLIKEKLDEYQKVSGSNFHPIFFEFIFLMAMVIFDEAKVEYLILETGLGGRLDATNVIENKTLAIISKISYDHMEYLGNELLDIAAEKAGIMRDNVKTVTVCQEKEVLGFLGKKAAGYDSPLEVIINSAIKINEITNKTIDFSYQYRYDRIVRILLPTKALYQTENASCAIHSAFLLNDRRISCEIIREGIEKTVWPGRMEEIRSGIIIDGAHNEEGVNSFLASVKEIPCAGKRFLLFANVKGKRSAKMVEVLRKDKLFSEIIACPLMNSRSLDEKELLLLFKQDQVFSGVASGLKYLLKKKKKDDLIFITGSLYLYSEVLERLQMINFEEELKKFHPSLEVEDAEEAIYNQDLTDMTDILLKMLGKAGTFDGEIIDE